MLGEPLEVTGLVVKVLVSLGIDYLVGGSLASSLHGIPRATQDVDIVADIKPEHVSSVVKSLEADFYIDPDLILQAIHRVTSFNIIHLQTMFKIDVFLLKKDKAALAEMARRQAYFLSDEKDSLLYLASAEDTIVQKLHWYKLGNEISQRQWSDVLGVLQVQGKRLDQEYLAQTARHFHVDDLLNRAVAEAEKRG